MFRIRAVAAVVIFGLGAPGLPALAAEKDSHVETSPAPQVSGPTDNRRVAEPALGADVDWSLPPVQIGPSRTRPNLLPPLYASFVALQGFDAFATSQGLSRGAREANPVMLGVAGNPALFWTVKSATTIAPLLLTERMWRTNRVGAIALMVAANGVMAAVAANNARVLHQPR